MRKTKWGRGAAIAGALFAGATRTFAADAPAKPNVVVIVADDLGYGDVGFQGRVKELQTAWDAWNGTLVDPKWRAARANPNRPQQNDQKPRQRKNAAQAAQTI